MFGVCVLKKRNRVLHSKRKHVYSLSLLIGIRELNLDFHVTLAILVLPAMTEDICNRPKVLVVPIVGRRVHFFIFSFIQGLKLLKLLDHGFGRA